LEVGGAFALLERFLSRHEALRVSGVLFRGFLRHCWVL
jgi:hypothetical protein